MYTEALEIHDPRFKSLVFGNVHLEKLWTGARWAEGPAYFPAGKYLVWSDIPNDRVMRLDETDGSGLDLHQPGAPPQRPYGRPAGGASSVASTKAAAYRVSSTTAASKCWCRRSTARS